jgi:3-oxoacyl-[acyl-carrier protein] reductase
MEQHQPRNIIVTGGNGGMGGAIARAFVGNGDRVTIIGRNRATLQTMAEELGKQVTWQQADVSNQNEVAKAVSTVVDKFGNVDVLVNAAGFARGATTGMPLDEAEQMWDEVIDSNLKGSFLMAVAVGPHMTRPGGRIINISSIAAFTGGSRAGSMAYAAAKSGLHGLTYGLARELSPQGITVNAVAPGFVANTGFTEDWSEERVRGIIAETPVGRAGHADDIAAAVLYLASPEASFVTGEVLSVNGGWIFGH